MYQLVSDWGSDTFAIDQTSGLITVSALGLDHEEVEHYILIVSARDGGEPALTSTATVFINILDVNDNAPQFDKSVYSISVNEDVPVGTSLARLHAFDKDTLSSSGLRFEVEDAFTSAFSVSSNGTLITNHPLDRESQDFYAFSVTVIDGDQNSVQLTSTCLVEVTVDDVNDHAPEIDLPQTLQIKENSPVKTPIAKISVIDLDYGKNADVNFFLQGRHANKFSIGKIDGILRSDVQLDREENSFYQVSVVAEDGGYPSLSSSVDVVIQAEDVNDNFPVFNPKFYNARISENATVGMSIVQTRAVDLDHGRNGRVRYSIISGDLKGDLIIDEMTGMIKVNKNLDHEKRKQYDITIQAQDDGEEPLKDTATVSVMVLDVNDNEPRFPHSPYSCKVTENAPRHTLPLQIFQAIAVDKDSGSNCKIEYSLDDNFNGLFSIDSTSGIVYVNDVLDRELKASYVLDLIAQDSGIPTLSSVGKLTVFVEDDNDNAPEFENDIYIFKVMENVPDGFLVGQVLANDADESLNGHIR